MANSDFQALKPGYYTDITDEEYFGLGQFVASNSLLKALEKGYWYLYRYMNSPFETTDTLKFGNALHYLVLEPEIFPYKVMVKPQCSAMIAGKKKDDPAYRCSNDAVWFDAKNVRTGLCGVHCKGDSQQGKTHVLSLSGLIFLSQDEWDQIHRMRDAIMSHPVASLMLEGDAREGVVLWRDEETGVMCKGKIDHWTTRLNALVDVKGMSDASPGAFQKDFYDRRYFRQGAMYLDGMNSIGHTLENFVFIPVEKSEPHPVGVYMMDDQSLAIGRDSYRSLLYKFKRFVEMSRDPDRLNETLRQGYSGKVETLTLPGWAPDKIYAEILINDKEL